MWILDSEGDFLEGKRLWLRPGKKYLFGRVKKDGVRHIIKNGSVSRKHLVIEVSPVEAGNSGRVHARSNISITDLSTKFGTHLDGERIPGDESRKLTGEEHEIQLGNHQPLLRIKWEPIVLTFSFSTKDSKTKKPLAGFRSKLEDLDIKVIDEYLDATTHVVQTKRNTAKGLQALTNGKYIVNESFVDALVYAATPSDLENLESASPLETDFDGSWPDAAHHLPPPGKEGNDFANDSFAPNPDRVNVFEGYTFVFGDKSQYDTLHRPITNGHGKSLLYQVKDGVTTADEMVQFMTNTAGFKGLEADRDNGPGGVVHVRYRSKAQAQWSIELSNQIALLTDQRVIEQNEFINAILRNDASILCRQLRREIDFEPASSEPSSAPPPSSQDVQLVADSQPAEDASEPSKKVKGARVRKYVSKMKTFDDGFDINSIPVYLPEGEDSIGSPPPMQMELSNGFQSQQLNSIEEEEDLVSSLLPGATAMKRRRGEASQRILEESSSHMKSEEVPRPKRQKLDVLEAARQHREAEEDAARQRRQQEEELLQSSLRDLDVEKLKGLAIVEEMEVPARRNGNNDNDRWDERWNGRKNFKKYRRNGDPSQPRRRIQAVMIPMEEVARKDFGIGDHYWVSTHQSSATSARDSHQERSVSQASSEPPQQRPTGRSGSEKTMTQKSQKRVREERDSDSDDELRFRFRRRR
ncbi:DNA damage response protein RcaA [Aspergillus pseudoustus]|uniref:DNA damage response protein RcaA n=1 Tax=Aspergillus pseudoustus TaxID=1810923 RepID=A0ABR4IFK9_9EURO